MLLPWLLVKNLFLIILNINNQYQISMCGERDVHHIVSNCYTKYGMTQHNGNSV